MSVDLSKVIGDDGAISKENVEVLKTLISDYNSGLEKNRDTILTEKKALEKRMLLYKDVDPELYKSMSEELEKLKTATATKENDAETIKKMLTAKYEKELEGLKKINDELNSKYTNKIISESVIAELEKNGIVNPVYKDLLKDKFGKDAKIIDNAVIIGDKSITDYIQGWSETEDALAFKSPVNNSGAGFKKAGATIKSGFQDRYEQAKKNGSSNSELIAIKSEAFENGVVIN